MLSFVTAVVLTLGPSMAGPPVALRVSSGAGAAPNAFTELLTSPSDGCAAGLTASGGETVTDARASSAYLTDSTGAMTLCSSNQVRINGTKGYLSEGERTNYALRSEALEHADWSGAATVTADQAAPPWSASLLMDNVASVSLNNRYQCPFVTAGTVFSSSGYGRTASGTGNGGLSVYCVAGSADVGALCDSYTDGADGTATGAGGQCFGAIPMTTTVTRGTVFNTCSSSNTQMCIEVFGVGTGNGNKHWAGIQLESGGFSSSYIPTTATSATRAADDAHFTPGTDVSAEGCISGAVTFDAMVALQGQVIGGASTTGVYVSADDEISATDGTSTLSVAVAGGLARGEHTFHLGWGGGSMTLTVDGDDNTDVFDGDMDVGTLYLGSREGASRHLFAWLKNIKVGASATGCQ